MMRFLQYLTTEIHRKLPNSLIIWYDSLTVEGKVRWQNELTHLNKAFFDWFVPSLSLFILFNSNYHVWSCDGIFLNYSWNVERIQRSAELAGSRKHDVYVGNDMWGRGTYEGGGFRTYRAIKEIKALDLSAALFAPSTTLFLFHISLNDLTLSLNSLDYVHCRKERSYSFWTIRITIMERIWLHRSVPIIA